MAPTSKLTNPQKAAIDTLFGGTWPFDEGKVEAKRRKVVKKTETGTKTAQKTDLAAQRFKRLAGDKRAPEASKLYRLNDKNPFIFYCTVAEEDNYMGVPVKSTPMAAGGFNYDCPFCGRVGISGSGISNHIKNCKNLKLS